MYRFYKELELARPVSDYLKKQGYKVRYEIKIGFCRADILAFKNDETTAVELKLRDWKKAIIQAKNYQLGSNYVYFALPLMNVYNVLRKAEYYLKKEGIGLIVVNENTFDVRKIIDAKHSTKQMGVKSLKTVDKNMSRVSKYKFL